MEFEQILKLINAVSDSNLTKFELEEGNLHIHMNTNKAPKIIKGAEVSVPVAAAASASQKEAAESVKELTGNVVKSPLVGTFYSAASPEEANFVQVGDTVAKGQVLGIIEAMKLMNEIKSEYTGTVREILIENEETAEYGQPLFVIE